jgi:hypothetical protein
MQPADRQALEAHVIGGGLAFPREARKVGIRPHHFGDPQHRVIARTLADVLELDLEPERVLSEVARRVPGSHGLLWQMAEAAATGETVAAYAEQLRKVAEPQPRRQTLALTWFADIEPRLDSAWAVAGVLPQQGLAVIFGESGAGKSFVTLDLALHVATGQPWAGRRCRSGVVVYCAAENPASIENRLAAARLHRPEFSGARLAVLPAAVDLYDSKTDLDELLTLLQDVRREHGEIALVVVDTLARSMGGGDENAACDMGRVVRSCDAIREALATCVTIVHHAGKDSSRGARGSSALRAAADVEIEVTAENGQHRARITKSRDASTGAMFDFNLLPVPLGENADGETVTTCLVEGLVEQDAPEATRPAKALRASEQIALEALHELLNDKSRRRVAPAEAIAGGARIGDWVALAEDWRRTCYARPISNGTQDATRVAFNRASKSLQDARRVQVKHGFVWLAPE